MAADPAAWSNAPGAHLLLEHCCRLERVTRPEGTSARSRLEHELGRDLAGRLVRALTSRERPLPLWV